MATARQKGSKWYYRLTITVGDGTHKYIERGGFKTKKEALDAGTKLELKYKEGEDISRPKIMSFNFLQKEWLGAADSYYKQRTISHYTEIMTNTIIPYIGDYSINAIDRATCQNVIDSEAKRKISRSRLLSIKNCMSVCFKYAVKMNYLKESPMQNVSVPPKRSKLGSELNPPRVIRTLTKDELDVIFTRFPEGSPAYIPLILGYRCGLRIGEAFGVFVDDIDVKDRTLHVRRQMQWDSERHIWIFSAPKYCNPGEGRVIALDTDTYRILERQINKILSISPSFRFPVYKLAKDGAIGLEEGDIISPLNIQFTDGKIMTPKTISNASRVIHGKKGKISMAIPDFDFHMLRHTHASDCIAAGMDPVVVSKRLGHRSIATTYRYYVHETETQVTKSRAILNQMYE